MAGARVRPQRCFSATDVYFGSQINLGPAFGTARGGRAFVQACSERLQSRPGYKRASRDRRQADGGGGVVDGDGARQLADGVRRR